jgi:hypothetical protein
MTRDFIISEIQRTAEANNGKALGKQRFYQETGLKESDWYGKYWTKWSEAVADAGYESNKLNGALPSDFILSKLADYISEIGKFPTSGDLRMKARSDKDFPSHNTFNRYSGKSGLAEALHLYCSSNDRLDLIKYCEPFLTDKIEARSSNSKIEENGSVYLYKSGKHYKIGRTNDLKRRDREIKLQLPIEAELIHRIITDDPVGIEKYWHSRFSENRLNGEWFNLSSSDIKAFRRRKFM